MTTGRGGEAGKWVPLVYRGDGAWIGVMPDGEIGVGVETEGRASLEAAGYVPMWPFMERRLADCLDQLRQVWGNFKGSADMTPTKLIELTLTSAWTSGRQYWMQLAASWIIEMSQDPNFDPRYVRKMAEVMEQSDALSSKLRDELRPLSS
jgi:hypothetical protein